MNTVHLLARVFAEELCVELGDRWPEFIAKQASDREPICSSGDYCDSNMTMARAYERVYGEPINVEDDREVDLWNQAWAIAAEAGFMFAPWCRRSMAADDALMVAWIRRVCSDELGCAPHTAFFHLHYKDGEHPDAAILRLFREEREATDPARSDRRVVQVMCHG